MSIFEVKVPQNSEAGEQVPAGTYAAVMVALIDLGTHQKTYSGQAPVMRREVFLVWDIPEEKLVIGHAYTLSLSAKSGLRALIKQWRGVDLAADEQFDIRKLIGQPCILSVSQKKSGDKFYSNVSGASRLPKGMPAPKPRYAPFGWEIGQGDPPAQEWLPWWMGSKLADIIKVSAELNRATSPPQQQPVRQPQQPPRTNGTHQQHAGPYQQEPDDDEVPFDGRHGQGFATSNSDQIPF